MSPCIRRPCICRGASHFCVSYTIERAHCGILCLAGIPHMRDGCRSTPRVASSRATGSNDKECNMTAEQSQSVQNGFQNKIHKDKTANSQDHTSELQYLMRRQYHVTLFK